MNVSTQVPRGTHLLVGTPAYGGFVHTDFVTSLLGLNNLRIPYTLMTIGNESLITRARNTIVSAFYADLRYTHLLFLDADVFISAEDVLRMLIHGKDVVGAPVALKKLTPDGTRVFNLGQTLGEDGALLITERIGTAALLLSRQAIDALVADAINDARVYQPNPNNLDASRGLAQYDIFRTGIVGGEYLSEDYWVCRELRRLAFSIYVDPVIVTRHNGTMTI